MNATDQLAVPAAIIDAMIAHAFAEAPCECCGLLAGVGDSVTVRLPLVNELASATRFRSEPRSLFEAIKEARRLTVDILAVYHSHPTSAAVPSAIDIAEAHWPGLAAVIVSLAKATPIVRAWRLDEPVRKISLVISPPVDAFATS